MTGTDRERHPQFESDGFRQRLRAREPLAWEELSLAYGPLLASVAVRVRAAAQALLARWAQ